MLSIGWVMFWKAFVVGNAAILTEKYEGYRVRQKALGIPLRQRSDGVFVADDRLGSLEFFLNDLRSYGYMLAYAWWATLALLLVLL